MYKNWRTWMNKYVPFYNAIPIALNIFQNEAQTYNQSPYSLTKMKEKKNTKRTLNIFESCPPFPSPLLLLQKISNSSRSRRYQLAIAHTLPQPLHLSPT